MTPVRLILALGLLLPPLSRAYAGDSTSRSLEILKRAADSIDIAGSGDTPFRITVPFRAFRLKIGTADGQYVGTWQGANIRHERVDLAGYTEERWTKQDKSWVHGTERYPPLPIDDVENILNLHTLLTAERPSAKYRLHSRKRDKIEQPCVEVRVESQPGFDVCADPATGRPATFRYYNIEYQLLSYSDFRGRAFPAHVVIKGDGKTREEMLEATLQDIGQLPASFFEPPASAQPVASRRCLLHRGQHMVKKVPPEYPLAAKSAYIQGAVILGTTIGKDGRVADLQVLETAGQALDDAAARAVSQWQYEPFICDGQPTEVVTTITVNFHLRY